MADDPTKSSDVMPKKPHDREPKEDPKFGDDAPRVKGTPQPGDPIDRPTANAATGEHPEPTTKNEPTDLATGEKQDGTGKSSLGPTDLATGEKQEP